jgi:xylulose-5-phosphate/fructose-6-phosphate phosphoketolase
MIYITGPGHGGPALVANTWLEGTYSELYPTSRRTPRACAAVQAVLLPRRHPEPRRAGDARARSTRAASSATRSPTPSARRSTTRPGRRLRHRRRRGRDRPAGGRLALEQVPQPGRDGAVLPILHLNGYKIANPTVLARIPRESSSSLLAGYGYEPLSSSRATTRGDAPAMAATLDEVLGRDRARSSAAPASGGRRRARAGR